jgi:cytochrome b561
MTTSTTHTTRYRPLSIGLHWLMLLLLAAVYACVELRGIFPRGSDARQSMQTWHFMLGLSVFILAAIRLAVNLAVPSPAIAPQPPRWQALAARATHVALYALMLGMPLAGWLLLSAAGKPIPFFGLELPALIDESRSVRRLIKSVHETGGTLFYLLIGSHAAAALYHHYVLRDNTLRRMLPAGSES